MTDPDDVKIEPSWKKGLQDEFGKEYFRTLREFVKSEYQHSIIYPAPKNIFRAFELTSLLPKTGFDLHLAKMAE